MHIRAGSEQPCSCCLPNHSEQPCSSVCHLHRSAMLRAGTEQPCPSRFPTHSEQPYLELAQSSYAPAVAHPLKVAILRAGSKQPCSCRLPTHSEQPCLEPTHTAPEGGRKANKIDAQFRQNIFIVLELRIRYMKKSKSSVQPF